MAYALDKNGASRCALDASRCEAFSQKEFSDLISDAHARGQDYYIARVHCTKKSGGIEDASPAYFCYDARHLCKYIFEMVISADGRRIRIKNFQDPITQREISEINFFRMRYDSETPLRAEYVGNHVNFLESNVFRSRLFYQEDATEALSVNFQFKNIEKLPYIKKRGLLDIFLLVLMLVLLGTVTFVGVRFGKHQLLNRDFEIKSINKASLSYS